MVKVVGHAESLKWLGCMLCACPGQDSDVQYHLQQAAKAFQKHGWNWMFMFFFFPHLFAAGSRSWTVVLGSLQAKATK